MSIYEKWSIAISVLSAVATFGAVIVALWQVKYANKKKIKITITKVAQVIQNIATMTFNNKAILMLSVKVVNIGNRKIKLTDWGIQINRKEAFQIVALNPHTSKLPVDLEIENSVLLQTDFSGLCNALKNNNMKLGNLKHKPKVYVMDSTGKKHYKKMPQSYSYYLSLKDSDMQINLND